MAPDLKPIAIPANQLWAGSCKSELQLKVNCTWKWIVDWKWIVGKNLGWTANSLLAEPVQILSYNKLSAAIHLYMIRAHILLEQQLIILFENVDV